MDIFVYKIGTGYSCVVSSLTDISDVIDGGEPLPANGP